MQSFCFFGSPKEVGVRGLAPANNKKHKNFLVIFPAFVPKGTSFGRGADFVKVFALRARFAKVQVF